MTESDPLSPRWPPALAADPDWNAAIAMGVDVHLIEANLRLTPAERIRQHTKMLDLAARLRVVRHPGTE